MKRSPEYAWVVAALLRSVVWGMAIATIGLAGAAHVLQQAAARGFGAPALLATLLLAFLVGAWAGVPRRAGEGGGVLRERWLSAAALAAVAASYVAFSMVYRQLYPPLVAGFADVLLALALPLYGLGLVAPALVAWAERTAIAADDEVEGSWPVVAPLAAGSLLGAAVASLLAGLFVLPRIDPGPVLMGAAVLLLAPLLMPDPARTDPNERVIHEKVSAFGTLRITEVLYPGDRQPERRLYLNGEEESAELVRSGTPTLDYVAAAESWLASSTPAGAAYLFLGGGAYTLPRRIVERDSRARVVVVELDPDVTRIAYRYFGLSPHHGVRSVHGDARAYVARSADRFDRIYVDVYGGAEQLPFSLVTREAASALAERLEPGGVVAMNVIGRVVGDEARQLWSVVKTFADVFPNTALYVHLGRDFPDRQNLLLAGSLDPARAFPNRAGHFERWPASEWPAVDGVTIFRDLSAEPVAHDQDALGASGRKRA